MEAAEIKNSQILMQKKLYAEKQKRDDRRDYRDEKRDYRDYRYDKRNGYQRPLYHDSDVDSTVSRGKKKKNQVS